MLVKGRDYVMIPQIMSEIRGNVADGLDVNPGLKVVRESCGGDEPQNEGYGLSNRKKSGEQMREM